MIENPEAVQARALDMGVRRIIEGHYARGLCSYSTRQTVIAFLDEMQKQVEDYKHSSASRVSEGAREAYLNRLRHSTDELKARLDRSKPTAEHFNQRAGASEGRRAEPAQTVEEAFKAGFFAARTQESLISEEGPWYPKYKSADEAWAAVSAQGKE